MALMRQLALLLFSLPLAGSIPTPEAHFGHAMGDARRLVPWAQVVSYFRALDHASPSVVVSDLGVSTEGRPLILVAVADPETIAALDSYQEIVRRLADPRRTAEDEAQALVERGKPVVAITCSIHSTEVASTLTAVQFVYNLLTQESPRHRAILANTILLLVPSLNPDGIDKVRAWYRRWVGGPYEGTPMTELYHKYVGHDNNRDWYMFTQTETRHMVAGVHNAWRPQVVYDVHQMGPNGARMFVPPWIDPLDPNIDPLITQQVNAFGTAMAVDLTANDMKGVLVNGIYDAYTPARHYQSYHGALRLLSEAASARFATPIEIEPEKLVKAGRNYDATRSSWNFLEPWGGGEWSLRDIVEYQLVTFESVLYTAALRRQDLLRNFYRIGQRVIERGRERAIVVPAVQHDPGAATRLLRTLQFGDVEIERALADAPGPGGSALREGDYLVRLGQPYGSFANTLLAPQAYPDRRVYPGGPPKQPYDVTAHSLPLLLGVEAYELAGAVDVPTEAVESLEAGGGGVELGDVVGLEARFTASWRAVNRLLASGVPVYRDLSSGGFLVRTEEAMRPRLERLAGELGAEFQSTDADPSAHAPLRMPRVAVYQGHVPIKDAGWTRWLLDRYEVPHSVVGNERVAAGLEDDFDVLIVPDERPEILESGYSHRYGDGASIVPPDFRGGLGDAGAAGIRRFAMEGGRVLAFNRAAQYVAARLDLPVEDVTRGISKKRFYGPGSLLWAEPDLSHPLCFGMRPREAVWFESGPVFRVRRHAGASVRGVLSYQRRNVLASGWLLGDRLLAGQSAVVDVALGEGRIVLFGIRPQYRGQSQATFRMVFNGLHLGSAEP